MTGALAFSPADEPLVRRAIQQDLSNARGVAEAVERAGGDWDDVRDLAAQWERLATDADGRLARLRYDAAHPRCTCVDGGDRGHGTRCGRCHGVLPPPPCRRQSMPFVSASVA